MWKARIPWLLDVQKEVEMSSEVQIRLAALELAIKYFNEHLENEGDVFLMAADIVTFLKGETK